ncbi:MAG: acylphosphatase [Candidatus Marinimicrobia bacterium]|nr:acylphosphatase [Candidatus Neomarinimicrobiota bacterium]
MDQKKPLITREYVLTGRVQGVGFRWFTHNLASYYNIKGYVKNQPDGSVLVVAQGTKEMLELFEKRLAEGPTYALIRNMTKETIETDERYSRFDIR